MNTDKLARATFVLEKETSRDLSYLARRMGRSRSDLVREILSPTISDLASMVRAIPADPTPADLERFRRAGVDVMSDAYQAGLQELEG